MGKSKKEKEIAFDFQFGIEEIIPSKQRSDGEGDAVSHFKTMVAEELKDQSAAHGKLPTSNEVFIYIQQFFVSQKEYERRDIDNMAKTMLDLLSENGILHDDSQVRTLLVSKRVDPSVPQNFAYLALKELKGDSDVSVVRIAGFQRAKEFYLGLKKV